MTARPSPRVSSRKQPKQARSSGLVAAVLEAAVQVLREEGASRFTTARVAQRAGVSVGSLYQYFPNKAAILFRLQTEEWQRTSALLRDILEDRSRPPLARLRTLVHAFVASECEEVEMRGALGDAAPLYRDAPEAWAVRAAEPRTIEVFMREVLPEAPQASHALASDLIETTLSQVAKRFSEAHRTEAEIAAYADALADMFCAYVEKLAARSPRRVTPGGRRSRRSAYQR